MGRILLFHSGYLESLCDHLYDDLRPRILHEPRLTVLCEVCTVLQALMVLDVSALPDLEDEDDEDGATAASDELAAGSGSARDNLGRLHISRLLQMVLQDAQTRLFFKAQSIIESDIKYHVPKLEDLAYPEKLTGERPVALVWELRHHWFVFSCRSIADWPGSQGERKRQPAAQVNILA
jgi:hypothetical protein